MPMTIFKTDDEVAAPGWTLQCTELMAEFINECEWKRDVTGIIKKWFTTSNLILTSLLMEEMRARQARLTSNLLTPQHSAEFFGLKTSGLDSDVV